jgi:hypothetical protein
MDEVNENEMQIYNENELKTLFEDMGYDFNLDDLDTIAEAYDLRKLDETKDGLALYEGERWNNFKRKAKNLGRHLGKAALIGGTVALGAGAIAHGAAAADLLKAGSKIGAASRATNALISGASAAGAIGSGVAAHHIEDDTTD